MSEFLSNINSGTVAIATTIVTVIVLWARMEWQTKDNHTSVTQVKDKTVEHGEEIGRLQSEIENVKTKQRELEREILSVRNKAEKNALAVNSFDGLKTDIDWIKSTLQRLLDRLDK